MAKTCQADGCQWPVFGKGFCKKHQYLRPSKDISRMPTGILTVPKISRAIAIDKADNAFSIYIRTIFSNDNGICNCVTCGASLPIKQMDCGHYKSRKHMNTRYDINNCRPQCRSCNRFNDGDDENFRIALLHNIGEIKLNAVEFNSRIVTRLSENDLIDIAEEYSRRLKEVVLDRKSGPKSFNDG